MVTVWTVASFVIYGFDFSANGGGRSVNALIMNEPDDEFFFKIDDRYMYVLDTYDGTLYGIYVSSYKFSDSPSCYICGWYRPAGFMLFDPYVKENIIYAIEEDLDYSGEEPVAIGYPYLDLSTGEEGYVDDIRAFIGSDAGSKKYEVTAEYVVENFDELSVESYEDYDCVMNFMALYLVVFILIVWGIINLIIYRRRKKRLSADRE